MEQKKWNQRILILAVIGWATALYLVVLGVKAEGGVLDGTSACSLNETFDCEKVALSSAAHIFGLPVAAFLFAYFAFLLVIGLAAHFAMGDGDKQKAQGLGQLMFLSSAVFGAGSFYQLLHSFQMGVYCIFCLFSYAIIFLNVYASWKIIESKVNVSLLKTISAPTWFLALALVGLHMFSPKLVAQSVLGSNQLPSQQLELALRKFQSEEQKSFDLAGYAFDGADNAPYVVVEFADYQCPACAQAHSSLKSFFKANQSKIKLVHKPFPLSTSCNPSIQRDMHPFACEAAKLSICVFRSKGQNAFSKYNNDIFAAQSGMTSSAIRRIAGTQGLSEEDISSCLRDPALQELIVAGTKEGEKNGVRGTPTFFMNGRRVPIAHPSFFQKVLR